MQAVSVGPLLFPVGVIAILSGWLAASAVAAFLRKRGQADAAPMLWWLLLLALVVARVVFVTRWWSAYQQSPWWTIFDIRDRGFNVAAGCVALVMATLVTMRRRPDLKRSLPAAVAGGFAAAALTVLVASQLQATSHPPLSAATLHRLDGSSTTLAALVGKPMVINLWATGCPPCRAEMPMLVQASHAMPGVRFVFVDQGESREAVQAFLERERLSPQYTLLDADNVLSRDYRALGYPTTLVVDADGRLRDTQVGSLSRATLESHLLRITSDSTQETPAP